LRQPAQEKRAKILRSEGLRQSAINVAEGDARAIATVYGAIKQQAPDSTLVAILQLDALARRQPEREDRGALRERHAARRRSGHSRSVAVDAH
jgi:regulator of protease activity HflC (stomatin/prohibitin superfamily)